MELQPINCRDPELKLQLTGKSSISDRAGSHHFVYVQVKHCVMEPRKLVPDTYLKLTE